MAKFPKVSQNFKKYYCMSVAKCLKCTAHDNYICTNKIVPFITTQEVEIKCGLLLVDGQNPRRTISLPDIIPARTLSPPGHYPLGR